MGLEFDHVFLTGMEEGICPHNRAINEEKRHRRRTPPGLRGHDARPQIPNAHARHLSPYFRQRTADAPAARLSRFLAKIPGNLRDYRARLRWRKLVRTRRYEPDPEYSYSADEFLLCVRGKPYTRSPSFHAAHPHRVVSAGPPYAPRRRRQSHARPQSSPSGIVQDSSKGLAKLSAIRDTTTISKSG